MFKSATFFVQIMLDVERPSGIVICPKWVRWRFNFLRQFTLPSLFNQSESKFIPVVICGRRHRKITERLFLGSNLPMWGQSILKGMPQLGPHFSDPPGILKWNLN